MANDFKKIAAQQRTAVPQVDPESTKSLLSVAPLVIEPKPKPAEPVRTAPQKQESSTQSQAMKANITMVDTSESPFNHGFSMYPSRHRQIAKDLAYIEDRRPWEIIEDALEEYVVRRYGKEYKRK